MGDVHSGTAVGFYGSRLQDPACCLSRYFFTFSVHDAGFASLYSELLLDVNRASYAIRGMVAGVSRRSIYSILRSLRAYP
jgi:hypothetical protein